MFSARSRFLDHIPHAILSVDAEPGVGGRLVVLRANGDIEVWGLEQGETYCKLRIAGTIGTPVRCVAWDKRSSRCPEGRFFSCGLHGLVTEWDLCKLSPRASWDSLGGAAWTMKVHRGRRVLAVGCEDGACSTFDLSDEGLAEPPLLHRTPPHGGRLLCVAFSPQGSHIACSAADGSVRIWHFPSCQALCRYVVDSGGRRKPPLVWSVLLLSDLTVITGDSTGHVSLYDGRYGSLIRRFGSHHGDILALAAASDESRVFASGVDQKIACFTPQPTPPSLAARVSDTGGERLLRIELPSPQRGWILAFSRRPHTHDVRALTTYEPWADSLVRGSGGGGSGSWANSGTLPQSTPMLVSGGIDTQLCLLPIDDFALASPIKLLPSPHPGLVGMARTARLLISHDTSEVSIWQLPRLSAADATSSGVSSGTVSTVLALAMKGTKAAPAATKTATSTARTGTDETGTPRKLLLLRPKLTSRTILQAVISNHGSWLAIIDSETRLYRLSVPLAGVSLVPPTVGRVPLPPGALPAGCAVFSPQERLLILGGLCGLVQTLMLDEVSPFVHTLRGSDAARSAIVQICVSPDEQWIATADSTQRVHVHSVDTLCFASAMPPLLSPPTALDFLPASSLLAVASANKAITLYDVEHFTLTAWSNAIPIAAIAASPEVPNSIAVIPTPPFAFILCAQSWLCRVAIDGGAAATAIVSGMAAGRAASASPTSSNEGSTDQKARKRKAKETTDAQVVAATVGGTSCSSLATSVVRSFGAMLLFTVLAEDEAIVVEQPWLRVVQHFSPALYKHRFGT